MSKSREESLENTVVKLIKELREYKNVSQDVLGELSGVSESYICKIENGERFPTRQTLYNIVRALINLKPVPKLFLEDIPGKSKRKYNRKKLEHIDMSDIPST